MLAGITFTVSPHATLPFCHAAFGLNAPWGRLAVHSIEEHVHGALYVDVQGGSLPPKPAANFSVSSDSCEFMWKTVGLEGSGLHVWNVSKRWQSEGL